MIRGIYAVVVLDLKRFWLDRARIVIGLLQPLLYLFILGAGVGASTQLGTEDYRRFIFPGTMGLTLLMTAMFAAISIVFDRQIGFFKAVLVSPVPRVAIAFGKIFSGAIQAVLQGLVFLPFAALAGVSFTFLSVLLLIATMTISSVAFSALGVAVAARFKSVTVFPIIGNALVLPMFFLSGALFPLPLAPRWIQLAAHLDPVAYAVDLMRGALLGHYFFAPWLSLSALIGFVALVAWAAVRVFNRGEDDSSLGATQFSWRK